jgi:predicted DNA-binding ArsR family transcriptional regulator
MKKIIKSYRKHVLYHTTYFNVAKQYIKSLTELDKVSAFTYGSDITLFVKESAIRQILREGGIN